ncbi:MAG: hypothetical protein HOP18_14770 [Deltaproteobacteria bacterium]|nr:hypothetical protein [Deltaproteobacteria bacterium]
MDIQTLLSKCRELGAEITPTLHGTIKLKAPAPLPDELREELRHHKAEVLALLTRPHINVRGELIIPFESDPRFHWWNGGQSIHVTLIELGASPDVLARYVDSTEILKVRQ